MLRRRSLPFSSLFLTCAALSLTACQDKRADDTEQVAPGLHLDKVDATKCPALGAPNKRIAIEGTPFSIASPDGFEIAQRETEVAREVICVALRSMLDGEPGVVSVLRARQLCILDGLDLAADGLHRRRRRLQ